MWAGLRGFDSRYCCGFSISPSNPRGLWGPLSLLYNGYQGISPGGKSQELEADDSPLAEAGFTVVGAPGQSKCGGPYQ
jgi:hypothetical protein